MIKEFEPATGRSATMPAGRPDFVPGVLVVRIKENLVEGVPDVHTASATAMRAFRLPESVEGPMSELRRKRQIKEVIPVFAPPAQRAGTAAYKSVAAAFALSVRDTSNEDLAGINLLRLAKTADLEAMEKEMAGMPGVQYAHRVPARWAADGRPAMFANDPHTNRQWGLRAIRWFDAPRLPDASGVRVGVLDTGIDTNHPDLQRFAAYAHDGASATDIVGHGTHVAGIIAATANNSVGIAGICNCDLHVWKIFGDQPAPDGEYYVDTLMYQRALNAVRTEGIQVINLSIGGTRFDQTEALLFRRLADSGIAVVAAMGNEYLKGNPTEYPASFPNVIAVGAINEANRRAPFSNTGPHIVISAPGTNILSTLPMKASAYRGPNETMYAAWSGTSMATPHVTAVAALVKAAHPDWDRTRMAGRITATATKLSQMGKKKRTTAHGAGLLNLKDAVQ